jgi:cell division protein FtsN
MPADAEIVISQPSIARAAAPPSPVPVAAATEPSPVPPPAARPPSHAVQVGAFSVSQNAEALAAELSKKYESVFINELAAGSTFYRVRIGSLPNLQAAQQLQKQLASEGFRPFVILPESTRH